MTKPSDQPRNHTHPLTNGKLAVSYGSESDGELEHWHYDTFGAVWGNRLLGKMMVTFVIDGTAKVSEMKVESLADFQRVAPKADTTTGVRVAVADLQSVKWETQRHSRRWCSPR